MAKVADFEGIEWGNKVEITYTPAKTEDGTQPADVTETVVFREVRNDTEGDSSTPMILRHSKPRGRKRTHTPLRDIKSVTNLTPAKVEKGSGDGEGTQGEPEGAGAPA